MVGTQGVWAQEGQSQWAQSTGRERVRGLGDWSRDHSCGREFRNQGEEGLKKGSGGNGGQYVGTGAG